MSKAKAREYINNAVQSEFKNFKTARDFLNTSIHSLNISYSVFVTNNTMTNYRLSNSDLRAYYEYFIIAVKQAVGMGKVFKSIKDAATHINRDNLLSGPILVRDTGGMFLIGADYNAVRLLLSQVVRQDSIRQSALGVKIRNIKDDEIFFKSILQLGHIGRETPLAETIAAISKQTANTEKGQVLKVQLDSALQRLVVNQPKVTYTYLNTANNSDLPTGIVNIVVQPEDVNANFSKEESKVYLQVLKSVRDYLGVLDIPGSNTLKQDAVQFTSDKILSELSGKKIQNIKPHSKVDGKVPLPNAGTKQKVTVSVYKDSQATKPPVSTVNLTSLQNLINQQLQDVISANMGDGSQRNVLNYRTGRFAGSAKVERMSESRDGMITAFYSYMKNPYQTFEPGFRQGSPRTRDPKLLIAKSIREIAETRVANRLRAVSI
jgi:hypothetical protein